MTLVPSTGVVVVDPGTVVVVAIAVEPGTFCSLQENTEKPHKGVLHTERPVNRYRSVVM